MAKAKEHHYQTHAEHHGEHHHEQPSILSGRRGFNLQTVVVLVVLLVGIGLYLIYRSRAAGSVDWLALNNSGTVTTQTVSNGATVSVPIYENSNTDAIDAVEADLTYDATKLSCTNASIDTSNSAFSLEAAGSCGSGVISIARASANASSPKSLTGLQLVATINFTVVGTTGSAAVNFNTTSSALVKADSTTANVLGGTFGGTYTIADIQPPSVPTGVTSPSQTATSISLAWTASTDNVAVAGYNIFRDNVKVGTSTVPSYTDTGLTPSTSHSYQISAYDTANPPNTSGKSTAASFSTSTDTTKPSTPTGLTSPSQTDTTVSLSWNASTDNVAVAGYQIFRGSSQVGTTTGASATTYTDTGLTPSTSYSYTVKAVDTSTNVSNASTALAQATKADTTKPSTPTGLNVTAVTSSTVALSWNPSTDDVAVAGYRIFRGGAQVGTTTGVNATTFTDTGLAANTTYSYTVAAVDTANPANVSNQSTAVNATTSNVAGIPGDITGNGCVNIYDQSILSQHMGQTVSPNTNGDLDGNGTVNILDQGVLSAHWHEGPSTCQNTI